MTLDGSCSQNSKWKYHVFLSFRGEDTRLSFTDHLYAALVRKSIKTFRDDEELARGDVISQKLLQAIEESLTAIIIISPNYANSSWCLDELQKIVECKQKLGLEVFPVFYCMDPSDVRHQKGCFAEAFQKHEEKFVQNKGKVDKWRGALREVADLSGWDSKNRHETKLIKEIVEQVMKKLEPKFAIYNDGLVAMKTKVKQMNSYLKLGLEDVRFIGIWGMGGIGKSTLANVIFKKIRNQFDVSCFLADVRVASEEGDQGMVHLQNKVLSHLKLNSMEIETTAQGKDVIRKFLQNKKVLLILDDLSTKTLLEILAGKEEWFGPGSRIIVTTKNKQLLMSHGVSFKMYEMKFLSTKESLHLFCQRAFKSIQPKEDYLELSKRIVKYSGGLPLALEVLGSFLSRRSLQEWEDALIKISKVQPDDILNKLKICYDMLEEEQKIIFLDIACFFKGWYKDKVAQILENCDLHPIIGINVLIEKSLITCHERVLGMHDLLEELGKTIVVQESLNVLGRRSRLWSFEDIDQVLKKNVGTEKVRGIVLKSSTKSYKAHWHPQAFSKMCNVKFVIILCDLHLPRGLERLSSSLKVIIWKGYPLEDLPLGEQLDELVHLQLCGSKVKKLWKRKKLFRKLKLIDLCYSKDLIGTPNISGVPNLEELFLDGCENLIEVHQSVGQHKKLAILRLTRCINLTKLPIKLEMQSLKMLFLSGCSNIRIIPEFGEKMEFVSVLNLTCCKNLICLPNSIGNLKSLKILNLCGCKKVRSLPDNVSENKALEDLDLSETSIREVSSSLFRLQNLKRLSFYGCGGIRSNKWLPNFDLPLVRRSTYLRLPQTLSGLSSLTSLDLGFCNLVCELIPEDLGNLPSLERLNLIGNRFSTPPRCIANLPKLHCLEIDDNTNNSEYRALLPPRVRIYPQDSDIEAALLNPYKVWRRLFKDNEHFESREPHLDRITISPEPQRFYIQNFFPEYHTSASIKVDIHDDNHIPRGEWWGIAVFIALEPSSSMDNNVSSWGLNWSFEAPHPEAGPSLYLLSSVSTKHRHVLLTMLMSDDCIYFQLHPIGSSNNIDRSRHFCHHWKPEFLEYTKLHLEAQTIRGVEKIREFQWQVLCKEDLESLRSREY